MSSPPRFTLRLAAVLGFALLIALCARLTVPMVPVPMTMQTWAVLLAGMVLGPRGGVAAVLLYLAAAIAGAPVLSDGASGLAPFTGATAGYLLAFPVAAGLAGLLARGGSLHRLLPATLWLFALHGLILALGTLWLAGRMGLPGAIAAGFAPFLVGAAAKSLLAVLAARALRAVPGLRRE